MIQDKYIMAKFQLLSPESQVKILLKALDIMAKADYKNKVDCISLAMGIPLFPKVISIENIDEYKITVRFDNQEERVINFKNIFTGNKPFHQVFLKDYEQFKAVSILEDTLAWPKVGEWSTDLNGNEIFDYYDVDPGLLYEFSELVEYDRSV